MKKDQIIAFLGKDTEFEGKLAFTGAVRIDGRFKGEILTEGTLIVGDTAYMECDIRAAHIVVSGEVRGNVIAQKRIDIHAPGKVFGNLKSPVVVVEAGVVFEGHCQMRGEPAEAEKKVALLTKQKGS